MDPDLLESEAQDSSRDGLNTQVCFPVRTCVKKGANINRACTSTNLRMRNPGKRITNGHRSGERWNPGSRRNMRRDPEKHSIVRLRRF